MFRRVSSTSSTSEWCPARNRTACSFSGVPRSRCSRIERHTASAWSRSSTQVRSSGSATALALGPERLLVTLRRQRDHRVGRVEDRARRAVVALELDHGRAREALGELEDVAHRRRAERVDRLRVVAHDHQAGAAGLEGRQDVRLQRRWCPGTRRRARDRSPRRSLVPPRDGARARARTAVGRRSRARWRRACAPCTARRSTRMPSSSSAHQGYSRWRISDSLRPRVHRPRVDVGEGLLAREPPLALAELQLAADQVHQVGGVGSVQDGEVGRQAERPAVRPQQPVGRRVERPAPHLAEPTVAREGLGAAEHLPGRPPREREEQDPLGRHAPVHQVGHPAGERPGLARAGPGHDEERAAGVLHGLPLLVVEALRGVEHVFGQDRGPVRRGQGPEGQVRSFAEWSGTGRNASRGGRT